MRHILSKDIVVALKVELLDLFGKYRKRGINPRIADILFTKNDAANSYLTSKQKAAATVGIDTQICDFSHISSADEAKKAIIDIGSDPAIHGIIIELPANPDWDETELLNSIPQRKDIDGLSASSLGALMSGYSGSTTIAPATPEACIALARSVSSIDSKNVVVVGRGKTVGKPLSNILISLGATVTVCNSKTTNLSSITRGADIVFLATGRGHSFDGSFFRDGQIIIDAGISSKDGKIVGDANLDNLQSLDVLVTPVPGGVGPLTSVMLFKNLGKLMESAGV